MKNIYNMTQILKKILIIVLLVVSLAACKNNENDDLIGEVPRCTEQNSADNKNCIDMDDVGCLGCSIFTLMFNAVSSNVMRIHNHLTGGAMAVMMIGFSVWLSIRLLKFVSSVSESSISQVWNEIIRQAFLCVFCGVMASSSTMLILAINTFVYPIYATFLRIGMAIMDAGVANSETALATFRLFGENIEVKDVNINCTFDSAGIITKDGFPQQFLDTIICMIKVLKGYLKVGGNISVTLMRYSENFIGRLAGFFLMFYFWVVRIGFIFYLVDTIFQMGVVILILPVFIMSYAFKTTRNWTNIAFKNILASAGFLMCFSIIVTLVLRAMIELINKNPGVFDPKDGEGQFTNLGIGYLCLLLIGYLIYQSMSITQQITGSLIGGGGRNEFNKNLTRAMGMIKGWVVKGLTSVLTFGAALMPASVQEFIREVEGKRQEIRHELGRDKND